MKNVVYLLFFLLFSCSEEDKKVGDIALREPAVVQYKPELFSFKADTLFYQKDKFSGLLFDVNPATNDSLFSISYLGGVQHGLSKKYHGSGKISEIREYEKGRKNGLQKSYWENGNVLFEYTAVNDVQEGELREWDADGRLSHLGNYKNGQEEGEQKMWYDTGKIRSNYVIKNGRRYGLLGTKNCKNVSTDLGFDPE